MSVNVGLFGGTFDPVHYGHLSIAKSFIESEYIDQLWILLTPDPPHKDNSHRTDYESRKRMLEAAFSDMDDVIISDIERDLPRPSYTIQTIEHLKKQYPDTTFFLCIGEDSLEEFHEWHRYKDILKECELLVAERPDYKGDTIDQAILGRVHFISHEPIDLSSTELRRALKEKRGIADYIPEAVVEIIEREQLYERDKR